MRATTITATAIGEFGQGLNRPESVLTTARGDVFAADRAHGVVKVGPHGPEPRIRTPIPKGFLANGIALMPDGAFLVTNIEPLGGLWKVEPTGELRPLLMEVDGVPLATLNFVSLDRESRIWASVSTRQIPRESGMLRANSDGFLVLWDDRGARIVADGLAFANEVMVDPSGRFLYANETIGRRLIRYPVAPDGALGPKETVAEFGGDGIFPDGLAFDVDGGVWVVSVVSNRVIRIGPDGERVVAIDDADPDAVERAERAFATDRFGREEIDGGRARPLGNTSSMAFGGADRRTIYLGSIYNTRLAMFRSSVAGAEPVHWSF